MEIKLYNDIVFKWIFGRQEHTRPLISLLNAVLGIPGKFSDIRILNPFDISEPFKNEKQGVLDIRGKDTQSDDWFDLEIQVINRSYYPQRSKFYLAGLYRDQLEKSQEMNYDDLKPCYGIHILVETVFKGEDDAAWWHNHYAILNTRSYKPLADHWHLYYIELEKFLNCFKEKNTPETELEEWSYFLGTIQDNAESLDVKVSHNKAIKEVHDMLETFTKDDRLREQYRLHEEFLRVQRTDNARAEKLRQECLSAIKARDAAQKAQETAQKAQKTAQKAQKTAQKAQEAAQKAQEKEREEKEAIKRKAILFMKKNGSTKEEIVELLNIPLEDVERYG